ncbi:MAG: ATP-dependent Clp protease ATP-binding subunit [Candidatus Staskawiczbacteria bacterium]|nr:ATP-dependent Clp protease ATP-binding subunit [Candidatus Staskawiczbacteria bacterium]
MNFDLKNTEIFLAIKRERFPLFKFAKFFKNVFLFLSILSLLFVGFSFLNFTSGYLASKMLALFLSLFIIFWEIDLFLELKIKKPENSLNISDAALNPDYSNFAELLNFNTTKIVLDAMKFCKKKRITLNSTSLLYSAIKLDKGTDLICFRLGLDTKKLQSDIKNYLEKIPRRGSLIESGSKQNNSGEPFSSDFQETIKYALKISIDRKHDCIGEKEILVGLAKEDEFFKKVLVDFDLKLEDVDNLTRWLDAAKRDAEKIGKFWTHENLLRAGSFGKDFSTGYTITLDRYSIDWRRVIALWRFTEIIGHRKEIDETEQILAKSSRANVLIVGDPDADRKSIVKAIAQKCYLGTSLPELNNKRVVELDPVLLAAQIPDFEKLESTLDQIFSEAAMADNVILVIDNLDNFVGQKVQKAGAFDISGILSKYLPLNNFQFIGLSSYDGLHKNIEANSSFASLLEKVEVVEVTEQETINILQSVALDLEYQHKVLVLYPSIREIVNLTARYMPSLPFPKKALDILHESVVYIRRSKEKVVLPHHIAEIISKRTDIPVGKMAVKEKETLLNLENLIHNRIVNQEEAVKEISIAMRRARMGIGSKTRPMGTFLFLGPTGVGKTETAKALAQIYFGSEQKMIRLDMSEFQAITDIPRLVGATSPVEMQGILTTPVRETPFSLILLDEIEKAHPNILNLFLQVLDEGHITDGQGRKVVFTNTIIICTSNAGADMIFKQIEANQPLEKDKLLSSLFEKNIFRPEFINRFDAAIIFHPLTKDNLMKIAQLSLQSLQKSMKEKEIDFIITEPLKEKIVGLSYKPEYGAREMRRVIQDKVENSVAQALLTDAIKKGDKFEINSETFEIIVNPVK